nr:uncharacterized protein LOC107422030 [Ziziphus jujuba var. spinosa]
MEKGFLHLIEKLDIIVGMGKGGQPINPAEYFNMKHASARIVIERCFGLLKMQWGILRSPTFYPIKTQCQIITACCLLHNLIRGEMAIDPIESEANMNGRNMENEESEGIGTIGTIESSNGWTTWRDNLASQMYEEWRGNKHH